VTYGQGAKCSDPIIGRNSVVFNLACDPAATDPSQALVRVKQVKTCQYQFDFRTAEACTVSIGGGGTNTASEGGGGW